MWSKGSDYTNYRLSLCTSWCDEKQLFICVVLPHAFFIPSFFGIWKTNIFSPASFTNDCLVTRMFLKSCFNWEELINMQCGRLWNRIFHHSWLDIYLPHCQQWTWNYQCSVGHGGYPWGLSSFKGPKAESQLSLLWCLWIIIAFLMMEHWSPVVCYNKMSHWNVVKSLL